MAIADITKPMALDETLQATNTAFGTHNTKMDTVIAKLQGIIEALGLDTSIYKAAGNKACADLVASLLVAGNLGNVYNITDNGTTTSDFAEGAGKPIHVGDNVAIVDVGTGGQSEYKFDLLAGMVDLTNYVQKSDTPGLLKNDGTIDTNDYAEKVSSATNGNLAGLNGSGNLTDSGWNGAKDTTSKSGNPISISGLKSNQLASNLIITLEPIQAGSGTPSPSNIRAISGYDKIEVLSCGVNVWNEKWELGQYSTTTGEKVSASSNIRCKDFIAVKPGETYYMCVPSGTYWRIFCYTENYRFFYTNVTQNSQNLVIPSGCHFLTFQFGDGYGTTYNNNISLNYPNTFTSYIACDKTTDLSESLGQTVYWGRLNVRTGEFEVLGTIYDLGDLNYVYTSGIFLTTSISSLKKSGADSLYTASCYEYVSNGGLGIEDYKIADSSTSSYAGALIIHDSRYTDAPTFKTAIAGQKIVYKLATPFTIQLTPHEISLLKDYAYLSTNGKSISLDYHNGELASLADVETLGQTMDKAIEFAKTYHSPVHMLKIHESYVTGVDFFAPVWMEPFAGRNLCDALVVNNGQYTFEYSYGFRWVGDGTITKIYETLNGNASDYLTAEVLW